MVSLRFMAVVRAARRMSMDVDDGRPVGFVGPRHCGWLA